MTVNDLIRELSELPRVERELDVKSVEFVKIEQDGSRRYIALFDPFPVARW